MILPNYEHAVIDIIKLRDYCLSKSHPRGKHKAKVFKSVLGLIDSDAKILREIIIRELPHSEINEHYSDKHGKRYVVDIQINRNNTVVILRTAWIVKNGESVPRLTTCFIR